MLHAYFLSVKLSINNVSMEVGGEGWVSQMLTLTSRGGSEMAKIVLTLIMDSPLRLISYGRKSYVKTCFSRFWNSCGILENREFCFAF